MTDRLKVFVSGPISRGDLQTNIDNARSAARRLIIEGFSPLVPHLTCFMSNNAPSVEAGFPHETWMEVDLAWVAAADAVLRLPGESVGADREVAHAEALGISVYYDIEKLIADPPVRGHSGFHAMLRHIGKLYDIKQRDYGREGDPFFNIRASAEIGVEPWRGAWLRGKDKVRRIDRFCQTGTLSNEGVTDSFMDLAVYSLIALLLFREEDTDGVRKTATNS